MVRPASTAGQRGTCFVGRTRLDISRTFPLELQQRKGNSMSNMRTSISLGPQTTGVALEIKEIMKLGALADVIRLAITVLRAMLNAQKLGCELILRRSNGQQFSYSLSNPTEMIPIRSTPKIVAEPVDLTEFEAACVAVGSVPPVAALLHERSDDPAPHSRGAGGRGRRRN